jgi:DNA-nicking Smr family endonuclease
MGKKRKYRPPVLGPDEDLLQAFIKKKSDPPASGPKTGTLKVNRHGLPVMDKVPSEPEESEPKDFPGLLESYLSRPVKKKTPPRPMPYHKRIKRYPPPEIDLDLHGFTALGARLKAISFVTACKHQGYFTVRIVVGKGLHSDLGPVLPDTIEDVLFQLKQQDIVLGFAWEHKKKSRSGAVIVYLRQFSD